MPSLVFADDDPATPTTFTITKTWDDAGLEEFRPDGVNISVQIPGLPSEYKAVDYLEANGNQYIKTNYVPNNDTRIIADVQLLNFKPTGGYRISGERYTTNDLGSSFCFGTGNGTNWYIRYTSKSNASTNTVIPTKQEALLARNVIELDKNGFKATNDVDPIDYKFATPVNIETTRPIYIFAINQNNGNLDDKAYARLYKYQIYENDALVMDLTPCVDNTTDTAGLYDMVNGVFYPNSGSGNFTYPDPNTSTEARSKVELVTGDASKWGKNGNTWTYELEIPGELAKTLGTDSITPDDISEASLPLYTVSKVEVDDRDIRVTNKFKTKEIKITKKWVGDSDLTDFRQKPQLHLKAVQSQYKALEYVESDSTQYIDTGFTPNQDTRIEMKYQYLDEGIDKATTGQRLTGTENRNGDIPPFRDMFRFGTYSTAGEWYVGYGSTGGAKRINVGTDNVKGIHTIDMNKNVWKLDGKPLTDLDASAAFTYTPFTGYDSIYIFDINVGNSGEQKDAAKARVYSYKIWDDDTLVRDYIPAQRVDGKVGLYDLVEGKFYESETDHPLKAGPDDATRTIKTADSVTAADATQKETNYTSEESKWSDTNPDEWTYTFEIPDYEGFDASYEVYEDAIKYYAGDHYQANPVTVEDDKATITNTMETIDFTITKTWDDADYFDVSGNAINDYSRPSEISFAISGTADSETDPVVSKTVGLTASDMDASDNTKWTKTIKLPKYYTATTEEIAYTAAETVPAGYTKSNEGTSTGTVTNTPIAEEAYNELTLTIKKVDKETNTDAGLDGAVFTVSSSALTTPEDITTANGGTVDYTFKKPGTYTIKEKTAPTGYQLNATEYIVVVEKGEVVSVTKKDVDATHANGFWEKLYNLIFGNDTKTDVLESDGKTIKAADDPIRANVLVIKTWDDANNQDGKRPTDSQMKPWVDLQKSIDGTNFTKANGARMSVPITDGNVEGTAGDGYTWKGLPAYEDGKRLTYRVVEDGQPTGYTASYALDGAAASETQPNFTLIDGTATKNHTVNVTNTHEPEKVSAAVTKTWDDSGNQDGVRPTNVTFRLYADGEDTGKTVELTAGNDSDPATTDEWSVESAFTDLPKFKSGKEIVYTVKEDGVVDGKLGLYTASTAQGSIASGFTITNSYTPQASDTKTITRTITYTYLMENGFKASDALTQTVNLTRTPKTVDPATGQVTAWNDWTIDGAGASSVDSPAISGWTPRTNTVPAWDINLVDPKDETVSVVYDAQAPEAAPQISFGAQDAPQSKKIDFTLNTTTHPTADKTTEANAVETYELEAPTGGTKNTDGSVTVPDEGTYTIEQDGTVAFTPVDGFTGTATPVTVKGTDKNGLSATTTYTPTAVANKLSKTITREISYVYDHGAAGDGEDIDPVKDASGNPLTETQTITLTLAAAVNPDTGALTWPNTWSVSRDDISNTAKSSTPDYKGYTKDLASIPAITVADAVRNVETDAGGQPTEATKANAVADKVTVTYTPQGPTGGDKETVGAVGQAQHATMAITPAAGTMGPGYAANKITYSLSIPSGKTGTVDGSTEVTIEGEGSYTIDAATGKITFTPQDGFMGKGGVNVTGTDLNGNSTTVAYAPEVKEFETTKTVKRTIHYVDTKGNTVFTDDIDSLSFKATGQVKTDASGNAVTDADGNSIIEWYDEAGTLLGEDSGDASGIDWSKSAVAKGFDDVDSPSKAHYSFDRATVSNKGVKPSDSDIEETVLYTPDTYHVHFDANGGNGNMDDQAMTWDEASKLAKNQFTRTGYTFKSWNTSPDATGEPLLDEAAVQNFLDTNDQEITLYAQWEKNAYTVTYLDGYSDPTNGGTLDIQSGIFYEGNTTPPANPTREGYTFAGYSYVITHDDGTTTTGTIEDPAKIPESFVTGNVVFTALWEPVAAPQPEPEPEPIPAPDPDPEPGPSPEPDQDPSPTPAKTPTPAAATPAATTPRATPSTGDEAPVVALGLLALVALAVSLACGGRLKEI